MASPYEQIPDDIKRQAAEASGKSPKKTAKSISGKPSPPTGPDSPEYQPPPVKKKNRKNPLRLKRAGVLLTGDAVYAIRTGRKKLRKEMRAKGISGKKDFELTAGSLGLYFDKNNHGLLLWLWSHWLGTALASLLVLLGILFIFSLVQQMRGHFTVNLSGGMFKEGFLLSETSDFSNPMPQLFAVPAQEVPCISINQIPTNIDNIDGSHNDLYFAYTYYLRNEGKNSVDYKWTLKLNEETKSVSDSVWVMLFFDGEMKFYAKANKLTGNAEALPAKDDNKRGYVVLPIKDIASDSNQFEVVKQVGQVTYWRVIPELFESDTTIASGIEKGIVPQTTHKFTVVMWLEGDDTDANDTVIDGHLGVEMDYRLISETVNEDEEGNAGDNGTIGVRWKKFWDSIWKGLD